MPLSEAVYVVAARQKSKKKTVIVVLRKDIMLPEPCKDSPRYKGTRLSCCICLPCFEKHLAHLAATGWTLREMPKGWRPI